MRLRDSSRTACPALGRRSRAFVAFLAVIASYPHVACADDASDIAAVVTTLRTTRNDRQPARFFTYELHVNPPFARVVATIGAGGDGGLEAVLSKTSGDWRLLGSGGGSMDASIAEAFGVPEPVARRLFTPCPPSRRRDLRVVEQTVALQIHGRRRNVKILPPRHAYRCLR